MLEPRAIISPPVKPCDGQGIAFPVKAEIAGDTVCVYIKPPAGAPDFWDMPGAYLRARWIGPGRGYVDPVKEAQGAGLRISAMISTLEDENADLGRDLTDTLDQQADEEEMLKERGLTRTLSAGSGLLPDPSDAGNDAAPESPSENDKSRPDK